MSEWVPHMKKLRWVLVLPAGFLGAVVASFILHWILLASCTQEYSVVQMGKESLENTERLLMAFAGPLGFVLAGAKTAPRFQFATTIVLGLLVLIGGPILVNSIASSQDLTPQYGAKQWFLHLGAVVLASAVIRMQARERLEGLAES